MKNTIEKLLKSPSIEDVIFAIRLMKEYWTVEEWVDYFGIVPFKSRLKTYPGYVQLTKNNKTHLFSNVYIAWTMGPYHLDLFGYGISSHNLGSTEEYMRCNYRSTGINLNLDL